MRPTAPRFVVAIAALVLTLVTRSAPAQINVPAGFDDQLVVGGLSQPVAMAFVPGSTPFHWRALFVEQRTNRVRLIVNGALAAPDPIGTIPNVRSSGNEQGLLSLAVDGRWPDKPYVYVHYTSTTGFIRLSRFALAGDLSHTGGGELTLDPASRYDLLTSIPDVSQFHNGGCLRIGADNTLYFSTGEDFTYCPAQDTTTYYGKVLRLSVKNLPDGPGGPPALSELAPGDNPWAQSTNVLRTLQYAVGFRNPFRMQIDPADSTVYVGDVGNTAWEEVSRVPPGANCGWPWFEGNAALQACATAAPAPHTAPIAVYDHSPQFGGRSVMLLAAYRSPGPTAPYAFPPEYEGTIFFSDYYTGLFRGTRRIGNVWTPVTTPGLDPNWANGAGQVCDGTVGPDGALWYVRQSVNFAANTGMIRRIRWTGALDAPASGAAPLALSPATPNPARGTTTVRFTLPRAADVALGVLDVHGRRVRELHAGALSAGAHVRHWDGRDDAGRAVPAGVYFARLFALGETRMTRVVLAR